MYDECSMTAPHNLYFFEYEDAPIGPAHIVPGYFALDEQGEQAFGLGIDPVVLIDGTWHIKMCYGLLHITITRSVISCLYLPSVASNL
jgi:hypothetical protein